MANALTNGASQHSRTDRVSTTPFSRATDVVQPAAGFYDRGTSSANSTVGSDRGSSLPSQQPVARAYGVQVSRVNSSAPGGHERPSQSGIGKSGGTWDEQVRMAERAGVYHSVLSTRFGTHLNSTCECFLADVLIRSPGFV